MNYEKACRFLAEYIFIQLCDQAGWNDYILTHRLDGQGTLFIVASDLYDRAIHDLTPESLGAMHERGELQLRFFLANVLRDYFGARLP